MGICEGQFLGLHSLFSFKNGSDFILQIQNNLHALWEWKASKPHHPEIITVISGNNIQAFSWCMCIQLSKQVHAIGIGLVLTRRDAVICFWLKIDSRGTCLINREQEDNFSFSFSDSIHYSAVMKKLMVYRQRGPFLSSIQIPTQSFPRTCPLAGWGGILANFFPVAAKNPCSDATAIEGG